MLSVTAARGQGSSDSSSKNRGGMGRRRHHRKAEAELSIWLSAAGAAVELLTQLLAVAGVENGQLDRRLSSEEVAAVQAALNDPVAMRSIGARAAERLTAESATKATAWARYWATGSSGAASAKAVLKTLRRAAKERQAPAQLEGVAKRRTKASEHRLRCVVEAATALLEGTRILEGVVVPQASIRVQHEG